MRIKDISLENRPRERMLRDGVTVLSDAELLAVILQKGTYRENVLEMSQRLLSRFRLDQLANLSLTELQQIRGIGPAKAMQIKALFELNKRVQLSGRAELILKSPQEVFNYTRQRLKENTQEQFLVLLLGTKNQLLKDELVSLGTLNSSIIHPREIFKSAIKESAHTIILVHNHPSGDPAPSAEDEEVTERLSACGKLLNIKVIDHVILGKTTYYSFKEEGKI